MPTPDRAANRILSRLPDADFRRLVGHLETVSPAIGEVVAQPGTEPKWVHFPVSGVLSSMVVLEDGSTVEASTIGNEGMDGLYLLADPLANPYRINVQVQGEMIRMPVAAFKSARADRHWIGRKAWHGRIALSPPAGMARAPARHVARRWSSALRFFGSHTRKVRRPTGALQPPRSTRSGQQFHRLARNESQLLRVAARVVTTRGDLGLR